MNWRAAVQADWQRDIVRIFVGMARGDGRQDLLMNDGTWQTVESGVSVEGAGIELPRPALDAVLDAIKTYKGDQLDSTTETKVLREWLTSERGRVDACLRRHNDGFGSGGEADPPA